MMCVQVLAPDSRNRTMEVILDFSNPLPYGARTEDYANNGSIEPKDPLSIAHSESHHSESHHSEVKGGIAAELAVANASNTRAATPTTSTTTDLSLFDHSLSAARAGNAQGVMDVQQRHAVETKENKENNATDGEGWGGEGGGEGVAAKKTDKKTKPLTNRKGSGLFEELQLKTASSCSAFEWPGKKRNRYRCLPCIGHCMSVTHYVY